MNDGASSMGIAQSMKKYFEIGETIAGTELHRGQRFIRRGIKRNQVVETTIRLAIDLEWRHRWSTSQRTKLAARPVAPAP